MLHQPRQIYASTADRRHGRRWARRHRSYWVPASVLALAVIALVLSLAAPLSLGFDEAAAVCTLVVMHVLTAAIVIATFSR